MLNHDAAPPDAHAIVSSRRLPFPVERVHRAFTDPAQLIRWWGPAGFTCTFHELDLRPGGAWRVTLHAPDGTDHPNDKRFLEITPTRIVLRHQQPDHDFTMTMTFAAPTPDTTLLTWHLRFDSAVAAATARPFILEANEQNFDRLAAHLAAI